MTLSHMPRSTKQTLPVGLSDREREILRLVVTSFVQTADPIGSRYLSRTFPIGLSAASIRNTMSDLEDQGYLDHPYTSAGRIPTEMGYRTFVNYIMKSTSLSRAEKLLLETELKDLFDDTEKLLEESSRILGSISNLLGVALTPKMSTGILERIEVVPLSSSRVMFVVSVQGGVVRTLIFHANIEMRRRDLDRVVTFLNERLVGLTLDEIRRTVDDRVADVDDDFTGVIQLAVQEKQQLFSTPSDTRLRIGGTHNLLRQPEFQEPQDLRSLLELIENKETVVRLLEPDDDFTDHTTEVRIGIGSELGLEDRNGLAVVTAQYTLGQTVGTIGVIGPKRMEYSRVVSLVEGMAALLSQPEKNV